MENVLETALIETEQFVRECEQLVAKQAALVDRLEKEDCPPAAKDAREVLVALEKDLDLARAHLRIEHAFTTRRWSEPGGSPPNEGD